MVLIMTTTWIPPSQIVKMGELAASEEWQKLLNPDEKNLTLLGGVTSTKDGYKSIWVKKVDLEKADLFKIQRGQWILVSRL